MTCLRGVAVGNGKFTGLDYAHDIVLLANTQAEYWLGQGEVGKGLNVSWTKTKVQ